MPVDWASEIPKWAAVVAATWAAFRAQAGHREAKESKVIAANTAESVRTAEVVIPREGQMGLYERLESMTRSVAALGPVIISNKEETGKSIAELQRVVMSLHSNLDGRLEAVEKAVKDNHLLENRVRDLEGSIKLIAGR